MHLIRFPSAARFRAAADSFLLRHEAQHGLMLGILGELAELPPGGLAVVAIDNGGSAEVLGVAFRLDTRLLVSRVEPDARDEFAQLLRKEPCSAVVGNAETVRAVTAAMARAIEHSLAQGVYVNRRVMWPDRHPTGARRLATPGDEETLIAWHIALSAAIGQRETLEHARESIARRIASHALHVWEDGGRIVSSAAAVGRTAHGVRINLVYTPLELRGRGYASMLVADLTDELLRDGREFVFLHTDLANPTSNRIYQRLGYERAGDFLMASFEPAN